MKYFNFFSMKYKTFYRKLKGTLLGKNYMVNNDITWSSKLGQQKWYF